MKTYKKNGKSIKYLIERKKIKNAYFKIKEDYISITSNSEFSETKLLNFLDLKFDTFKKKLDMSKAMQKKTEIFLWGTKHNIEYQRGTFDYYIFEGTVYVTSKLDDHSKIKQQIYKKEMEKELSLILPDIEKTVASKMIKPVPIKLKFLRSKFGSYHSKNKEITLNTFLATLKPISLKYVVYHEYAHVLVFNHSKSFYEVLKEFMPKHRIYQKELKLIVII